MRHRPLIKRLCLAGLLAATGGASAGIDVRVEGLDGALRNNVNQRLGIRAEAGRDDLDVALVEALHPNLPRRLLALHLGNGASLCAIRDGRSVATTMGYSPLDGLTMGTRSGALDCSVALRLARELGADRAESVLNAESGLLALAGSNDMATLLGRKDAAARFAVDHFCYWAARHAGSMVVAMGGLDALAFTGGIGENAPAVRAQIVNYLKFLGDVPVHVIPAQEERQIARDVAAALKTV